MTFNHGVESSSLSGHTNKIYVDIAQQGRAARRAVTAMIAHQRVCIGSIPIVCASQVGPSKLT